MAGIYTILNPAGSIYVGQSHDVRNRFLDHKRSPFRPFAHKSAIRDSLIKYGVDAHIFDFKHRLPKDVDQIVLDIYEQFYIDQYREAGLKILNLRGAGSRGKLSEVTKQKVSKGLTGLKQSKETVTKRKNSISEIPKEKIIEQRKRMSDAAKEFYKSEAGIQYKKVLVERLKNYSQHRQGPEYLKKLSDSHKGHKQSDYTKIKRAEALKKYWDNLNPEQRKIRGSMNGRKKNK